MAVPYIPLTEQVFDRTEHLSNEQLGALLRIMKEYSFHGCSLTDSGALLDAGMLEGFILLKELTDRRQQTSESRRRARAVRGGKVRNAENGAEEQNLQNVQNVQNLQNLQNVQNLQNLQNRLREKEKEKESERENEKERSKEKEKEKVKEKSKEKESGFIPPTLDEIAAYLREKNLQGEAEAIYDHYTANGWMVGSAPMNDWKAAVRNWSRQERRFGGSGNTGAQESSHMGKHVPVQDYAQRDYSDMQQKAMERFIAQNMHYLEEDGS